MPATQPGSPGTCTIQSGWRASTAARALAPGGAARSAGQAPRAKPPGMAAPPVVARHRDAAPPRERLRRRGPPSPRATSGWSTGWSRTASAPRRLRGVEAGQDRAEHPVLGVARGSRPSARPRAARPPRAHALGLVAEDGDHADPPPGAPAATPRGRGRSRRPMRSSALGPPMRRPRPRRARRPTMRTRALNHGFVGRRRCCYHRLAAMKQKHLLSLRDYSRADIDEIFDLARRMKARPGGLPRTRSAGKTLAMIFQKPSTRTRVSFEVGHVPARRPRALPRRRTTSSSSRGETVADTARVLSRYVDGIMARVFAHQDVVDLARHAHRARHQRALGPAPPLPGAGRLLHPAASGAAGSTGLKLAYVGDGNNVCHALMLGAVKLGVSMSRGHARRLRAQPAHREERARARRRRSGRRAPVVTTRPHGGRGGRRRRLHRRVDVDGPGGGGGGAASRPSRASW